MRNLQGDIVGIVNSSGVQVVEYLYDAWGRQVSITGSMASTVGRLNPFRYRGYVYDDETGLYYLRSRYYNPEWGRFINADTLMGQVGGTFSHNLFAYCGNSPVNKVDPSGFVSIGAFFGALLAILRQQLYIASLIAQAKAKKESVSYNPKTNTLKVTHITQAKMATMKTTTTYQIFSNAAALAYRSEYNANSEDPGLWGASFAKTGVSLVSKWVGSHAKYMGWSVLGAITGGVGNVMSVYTAAKLLIYDIPAQMLYNEKRANGELPSQIMEALNEENSWLVITTRTITVDYPNVWPSTTITYTVMP